MVYIVWACAYAHTFLQVGDIKFFWVPLVCLGMKSPTQTCEEHENHKEMPFIQGMSQRSMTYSYKVQNVNERTNI